MKKLSLLVILLAFVLAACGTAKTTEVKATVAGDPLSKATQAVVEKWVTAIRNRDTDALLSLYSDDMVWSECSTDKCYQSGLSELKYTMGSTYAFGNPDFKVEPQSYFVTDFGHKAVVQTLYTDPNTGSVKAPSVTILEFKDGKITGETWYSAATP